MEASNAEIAVPIAYAELEGATVEYKNAESELDILNRAITHLTADIEGVEFMSEEEYAAKYNAYLI